jgi:hypothetical protein
MERQANFGEAVTDAPSLGTTMHVAPDADDIKSVTRNRCGIPKNAGSVQ